MNFEELINDINSTFKIDIRSRKRNNKYIFGKKLFCKILRNKEIHYTYSEIGKILRLDHATVLHHCRTFDYVDNHFKIYYNNFLKENGLKGQVETKGNIKVRDRKEDLINDINHLLSQLPNEKLIEFRDYRLKPYLKLHSVSV